MASDMKTPATSLDNPILSNESSTLDAPRQNLIETAIKFLQNPQVQSSAISARKAFLKKKGLTEVEIDIALERSGVNSSNQVAPYIGNPVPAPQQLAPYHPQGWRGYTALAVVVGSAAYCIYKFYQNVISPLLKRRKEEVEALQAMEEAVKELKSSVSETVNEVQKMVTSLKTTLDMQEQKLDQLTLDVARNKSMATSMKSIDTSEIRNELVSLKGLLLSRNQFPRTPKPSPIPAWQMASGSRGDGVTGTTQSLATNQLANQITDDGQNLETEQVNELAGLVEDSTPSSSKKNTPLKADIDGQVKITRSLSGSFETSPSNDLNSAAVAYQNGNIPINGHMISNESFSGITDDHDSNKSDDSVD